MALSILLDGCADIVGDGLERHRLKQHGDPWRLSEDPCHRPQKDTPRIGGNL